MDVDEEAWIKDRRSQEPCRPQSQVRLEAVRAWIKQALRDKIIKPSDACAWSQIMLTPKPDGSWRMAIDYRCVNSYTKSSKGPIPNIRQLLRRVGAEKPRYFSTMDMTSGFHQAPMEEESRKYTTFISEDQIYEFLRASMGLKNTPWYFQGELTENVLKGLIHRIVELYIDDLLTWATTFKELIERLRLIFERFRKHKMTMNPKKCKFGMKEIEYVGYLIDENGITFAPNKLSKVQEMQPPETLGELKSYIGVASYFRNHIRHYTEIMHPIMEMAEGYQKKFSKRPVIWDEIKRKQFKKSQEAIINCAKLHYSDPTAPIRVYTDASNYGIGAYVCQVVDGQEIPVEFISKSLTKAEKKWSTFEKEAYAIFYALRRWNYLLQDVRFTLYTDHRNLTFLNKDPNAKVMRWKLAVQDYDFEVVYIPGEENIIADAMSRFCSKEMEEDENELEKISIQSLWSNTEWLIPEETITNYEIQERIQYRLEDKIEVIQFHALKTADRKASKFRYIPKKLYDIIQSCHNAEIGHWGHKRTTALVNKVLQRDDKYKDFKWNTKERDIYSFISRCDICIKRNKQQIESRTNNYSTSTFGIFKNISIDSLHFHQSTAGYKYVLVFIDSFTRYVVLKPIKELTAKTAAKAMIEFMSVYGIPIKITTDNASQFQGEYDEFIRLLQIEGYKIHPYSHEENSIVERANKEVIRHLQALAYQFNKMNQWEEEIIKVQAIMNNNIVESTGLTPNEIVFTMQVDNLEGKLFPQVSKTEVQSMSQFMQQQIKLQQQLIQWAEATLQNSEEKRLRRQDIGELTKFAIGQYVVALHENKKDKKLKMNWHGPYRVTQRHERKEGDVYTVYCPKSIKYFDFHVKFLQLHPASTDQEAILSSIKDEEDLFIIETVLDHEIVRGTINFKIKWYGYSEPEWNEINSSLKTNGKVLEYAKRFNLEIFLGKRKNMEPTPVVQKRTRFLDSDNE